MIRAYELAPRRRPGYICIITLGGVEHPTAQAESSTAPERLTHIIHEFVADYTWSVASMEIMLSYGILTEEGRSACLHFTTENTPAPIHQLCSAKQLSMLAEPALPQMVDFDDPYDPRVQ